MTAADKVKAKKASMLYLRTSPFTGTMVVNDFFLAEKTDHQKDFQSVVRKRR